MVRFIVLVLLEGAVLAEEGSPAAPVSVPQEPVPTPQTQTAPSVLRVSPPVQSVTDGEYEIDYEEEVAPEEAPAPMPKRSVPRAQGGGTAVQGSRAKDRFTPILKSETKSVYKKGGKHLDVDPD
ncbi:MAG: hypothetical protein KGP28_05345 [Bdellovibrionales bacterium]|nr:hypothetical protein [Bdellovibrionales bacterium]